MMEVACEAADGNTTGMYSGLTTVLSRVPVFESVWGGQGRASDMCEEEEEEEEGFMAPDGCRTSWQVTEKSSSQT